MAVLLALSGIMAAAPVGTQEEQAVRTVAAVDLDRYVGEWFEIARFPNRFQRNCAGDVTATYERRDDGRIDVTNRCRQEEGGINEAVGVAKVVDEQTRAALKVRFAPAFLSFLPFVWGDYWILGLSDDYSWAVVGSPDREYLWILSRSPAMDSASYQSALDVARANGFAIERLMKTRQTGARDQAP